MMKITEKIRVEMAGNPLYYVNVPTKQGDVKTRYVDVELWNNGEPFAIPEGATVRAAFQKPDGFDVLNDCVVADNIATIELTDQLRAVPGKALCELMVQHQGKMITSSSFVVTIYPGLLQDGKPESSDEYQSFINALLALDTVSDTAKQALENALAAQAELDKLTSGAEEAADRSEAAAVRSKTAAETSEANSNKALEYQQAADKAQKDVATRQAEINTAHEDVTAKHATVLQAASQVKVDREHVDQAVADFDATAAAVSQAIDNRAAEAEKAIDTAVETATAEISHTASNAQQTITQQEQAVEDLVSSAETDISAMVSDAQQAEAVAEQCAQEAQGYRDEAQAAADSVGDAISPALLTGTAAGTGAVTMDNTADYPLQSLVITGETQRDGVPEPANPVYPVSLGNSGTIGVKVCGRNLLDWEGAADYNNWHTTSLDDDHPYGYYPYLIVNGFVPGVTYTIAADSIPALGAADLYCLLGTYPGANKGQANWMYHKTSDVLCKSIRTFVADSRTYYLNCNGCKVDTVGQVVHDWLPNLRIYQGSYTADTIPPYQPYKGQTVTIPVERPIMRIGSAADTVDLSTGDGLQMCDKIEFDGTEKWFSPPGSYANYTYCVMISKKAPGNQTSVCSHYRNVDQAYSANIGEPGMYCDHKINLYIYFVSEKSTLGEFTAWLAEQKAAGTPVTLWYQLAQPTTYQVTPVSNLRSCDGTTTVAAYGAPGEPSPEIEVKAVLDATTVVTDQQAQIDELREMISNLQSVALTEEIGGAK